MTHEDMRDVVLGYIPAELQPPILAALDEHRRLRVLAPAPVVPLTPDEIDRELPGYLAKEGRR